MRITEAINVLFPSALNLVDFVVRENVPGEFQIINWNPALGTQPTIAELAAVTQEQVDAAQLAQEALTNPDKHNLKQTAASAVADLDTYLAIESPTNAQVAAIVRKLCQQNKQIIKRLIQVE